MLVWSLNKIIYNTSFINSMSNIISIRFRNFLSYTINNTWKISNCVHAPPETMRFINIVSVKCLYNTLILYLSLPFVGILFIHKYISYILSSPYTFQWHGISSYKAHIILLIFSSACWSNSCMLYFCVLHFNKNSLSVIS